KRDGIEEIRPQNALVNGPWYCCVHLPFEVVNTRRPMDQDIFETEQVVVGKPKQFLGVGHVQFADFPAIPSWRRPLILTAADATTLLLQYVVPPGLRSSVKRNPETNKFLIGPPSCVASSASRLSGLLAYAVGFDADLMEIWTREGQKSAIPELSGRPRC